MIDKLTLNELKSIEEALYETYQIDFGNYALTSFRRRVSNFLAFSRFSHLADFIHKITTDVYFFEAFIKQLAIDETELFRDPTMWRELKNTILPPFLDAEKLKVWVIDSTTGDELISLMIILKELNFLGKAEVIASNINKVLNDTAFAAAFDVRKVEIGAANYKRYRDDSDLTRYYSVNNKNAYFDYSLLRDVTFQQYIPGVNKAPQNVDLVLFRNKMIFHNRTLQNDYLNEIYFSLNVGGVFVIGIKESLGNTLFENQFELINATERIYKKL
jgi:chemotaxis protein methyltransferase CheR